MTLSINEHAKFAPSAAARWVKCPGSVSMCERHPELTASEKAREGTAAHWVWQTMLNPNGEVMLPGVTAAPNGYVITDEMIEGAELFIETVTAMAPVVMLAVEQRLPPSRFIHADNWGTPDIWALLNPTHLYLADYKFGHQYVEVFHNWQLVDYAALILDMLGIDGHAEQSFRITFDIVQPRSFHRDGPVRRWECLASELRSQRNVLHSATVSAEREQAPCFVNTECINCSARAFCPTLAQSAYAGVDLSTEAIPIELPMHAVGLELRTLERYSDFMQARISGLREVALGSIKAGAHVPFFRVEAGAGREVWNKPLPEVLALGEMMGKDLTKPGAITPKQAIKAGIPAEVVASFSHTPNGQLKLVPDDGTLAAKTFRAFPADKK